MTKEEAEFKVSVMNALEPDWTCPLINGWCKKTCVCYVPASVRSYNRDTEYSVNSAYCDNKMFTRE